MRFYKVDPELTQICDEMDLDENSLAGDYELGSSEELFIFSKDKPSSIWINRRLMSNNTPLIRVNIKNVKEGTEYTIHPLASTLDGSIVLNSPQGNHRYNLIFKT
jgi:hypothetical protein